MQMKIAISVPDQVFQAGELLARQLKLSRSQLYSDALAAYLRSRGAAEVTAQLNVVHMAAANNELDPALASAQQRVLASESW